MPKFLDTLSSEQKQNVLGIIECMKRNNITNTMMQAGILAVISKESSFIPKAEKDYSKTDNKRIRSIFGARLKSFDDAQLTALKKDPKAFFDLLYGGRYDNGPDEGYKYRGRGFNQLTFKSNYKKTAALINIDIVKFPDKLNEVPVATEAVISFFKEKFAGAPKAKLAQWNMTDLNSAKTIDDAVHAAYNANTGWGKTKEQIINEKTGGYTKAISRVAEFYDVTSGKLNLVGGTKPSTTIGVTISTAVAKPIKKVKVTASSLVVRKKPDLNADKVTERKSAKRDEVLTVYKEKNEWYKISELKDWWVSGKYCKDL